MVDKLKNNPPEKPKKPKGGPRPGSGRKPGVLSLKARTALEVRNRIAQKADHLLNAEFLEALGSFVVMKADPETLEYKQVTDEEEIAEFIQEYKGANGEMDGKVYIIAAKPGNYKSRQYLFDRAFGRPSQAIEIRDESDEELRRVVEQIRESAQTNGTTYEQERSIFLEHFADKLGVKPEIKEKLATEIIQ
jgi:hypothetical protein